MTYLSMAIFEPFVRRHSSFHRGQQIRLCYEIVSLEYDSTRKRGHVVCREPLLFARLFWMRPPWWCKRAHLSARLTKLHHRLEVVWNMGTSTQRNDVRGSIERIEIRVASRERNHIQVVGRVVNASHHEFAMLIMLVYALNRMSL